MEDETTPRPILRTKLNRPPVPSDHVHRTLLLDELEKGRERPLTLISAPAGYGKSTLASCWLAASDCSSAWLSLDERDNDLRLFLTYFLEAIRTLFPSALEETRAMLKAGSLPPVSVLAASLLNELEGIEQRFILVLDDFHRIEDPSVLDLLAEVLCYPTESMHLVLAGRSDPFLPISRLRARGLVTEIRMQGLRFTAEETVAFLEGVLVDRVEEAAAAAWAEKTEGWVTALRLAALSLRHQPDAGARMLETMGRSPYVTEYLFDEVMAAQTPAIHPHLLSTAIPDRFCAPLCDVLFAAGVEGGAPEIDGHGFIAWLKENNLFLIPLDQEGHWFRFHHLFRELLKGELERKRSRNEIAALHSRASEWFEAEGLIDEAIVHALAADDISGAVDLVKQNRYDLMNRDQWSHLERQLGLLPLETVETNSLLLMAYAYASEYRGQLAEAYAYRDKAQALVQSLPPESPDGRALRGEIATLFAEQHIICGEADRAVEFTEQALELLPAEAAHIRDFALGFRTIAFQSKGDIDRGLDLREGVLRDRTLLPGPAQVQRIQFKMLALWMEGDLNSFEPLARECYEIGHRFTLQSETFMARYFLGLLHYVRNERNEAEQYLADVTAGPYAGRPAYLAQSAFLLALIHTSRGHYEEAREELESLIAHTTQTNDLAALATAHAMQVELALRQGNISEALRLSEKAAFDLYPPIWMFYVFQLTPIKLLFAQNTGQSLEKAVDLINELDGYLQKTNRKTIRIDVLALQALILDAQGKEPAAFEKLSASLDLAKPGGFIRNFVDLGPPTADLLERLKKQIEDTDYIDQVLAAFKENGQSRAPEACGALAAPPPPTRAQPLIEPLTHRELETLELLTQGLYNKEIADKLSISSETVKSHLKNIYQKLGVSNRRQAVHRARILDILPEKGS